VLKKKQDGNEMGSLVKKIRSPADAQDQLTATPP
jgi:hypothetical protein